MIAPRILESRTKGRKRFANWYMKELWINKGIPKRMVTKKMIREKRAALLEKRLKWGRI